MYSILANFCSNVGEIALGDGQALVARPNRVTTLATTQ